MKKIIEFNAIIPENLIMKNRLDIVLSKLLQEYSRSYLKKQILSRNVFINGNVITQPKKRILGGELIKIILTIDKINQIKPKNIFFSIVYEDSDILIINKPSNLVVHPGAGNTDNTLLNSLYYRYKNIDQIPRGGIVHRLDKNTTGLMVIAKNIFSYNYLIKELKLRKIIREYQAIVLGSMVSGGEINQPIRRHTTNRVKMMVHPLGKPAITRYEIINRYENYTHIKIKLETGRTHQIRVHMLFIRHPLVGDHLYSTNYKFSIKQKKHDRNRMLFFPRQALHAYKLSLIHPITRNFMSWEIKLPEDMIKFIDLLKY